MIDLLELEAKIKGMNPRTKLYRVLKRVLSEQGQWKNRPRGNPKEGYKAMKKKAKGN